MTIAELYQSRKNDPRWNTSYPLSPSDWAVYRVPGSLSFENDHRLSFYIHIPFCKQLCSFCEYTRMLCPDETLQKAYLHGVSNDIRSFKENYQDFILQGFDIGGGTPTSLSERSFSLLLDIYDETVSSLHVSDDFEPSIEATFDTLSVAKLERITQSHIKRLSLGVQSSCKEVLHNHHRLSLANSQINTWLNRACQIGIKKINLDFMYGLSGQTPQSIGHDLELIRNLRPSQVTLYELRTNMILNKSVLDKDTLYAQYCQYYDGLIGIGYVSRFGQNTFSLDKNDQGVSSYLRQRMLNGSSYKGFGISAQSMSKDGISYNVGKMADSIRQYMTDCSFPEMFTYKLPPRELAAKYVAIAAYNGSFSLKRIEDFGLPAESFRDAIDYCLSEGFLTTEEDGIFYITQNGFRQYGAVFSLFYRP